MPQYTVVFQLEIKNIEMAMQVKDSLTDELNNALGWAGVGHVDGYDVDVKKRLFQKSFLRIFCVVVNSEIAKSVMKKVAVKDKATVLSS
ncbi:MAG: hypothetical protein RR954_09205 [Christensenellaceae bacterium]